MVKNFTSNKYKLFLALMLALLTTIVLVVFIRAATNLQEQITLKRIELANLYTELTALDKLIEDKEIYREEIKEITSSLPTTYAEVSYFTEEVERIATQSGMAVNTNLDKDAKDEKNGLASVGYSVESRGSYIGYSEMLNLMSNLPFHTRVDSLKIEGQGSNINSRFDFRFYIWSN
jgi:Tfp pilus assembly protein PilO